MPSVAPWLERPRLTAFVVAVLRLCAIVRNAVEMAARLIYRNDGAKPSSGGRGKDPCHVVATLMAT